MPDFGSARDMSHRQSRRGLDPNMVKALTAVLVAPLLLAVSLAVATSGPTSPPYSAVPSAEALAEIPPHLLDTYLDAAASCVGLPWQVLAAVGWVESRHAQGRADPTTGDVDPPILGPALDGSPGRARIPDPTEPDGWAHAHGSMQFLLATWRAYARAAPERAGRGADPDNAWDAIWTATNYLCAGEGRVEDLADAVWRYNHSQAYVEDVFAKAAAYGLYATAAVATGVPIPDGTLVAGNPNTVIAAALSVVGVPYVWGGSDPQVGFDCSGLVQWAYTQAGVALPRTTPEQISVGLAVTVGDLQPGDLVFTRGGPTGRVRDLGHVAIYVGGGSVVVAPRTGADVSVRALDASKVQAVRRVLDPYETRAA